MKKMNDEKSKQEIEAYSVEAFVADLYNLPDSEGFGVINNAFKMHIYWKKLTPESQKDANVIMAIRAKTIELFPNIYKNWEMQWFIEIVNEISEQGDFLLAYQTLSDNPDLNTLAQDTRFQKILTYIQDKKDRISKVDKALAKFLSDAELYQYKSEDGIPEFTRLSLIKHLATHIFDEAWLDEQEAKHPLLYGREYNAISILNKQINHAGKTWKQKEKEENDKLTNIPAKHYDSPDPFIGTYVQFGESGSVTPLPNSLRNLNPFMASVNDLLNNNNQIDYILIQGFSDKVGSPAAQKSTALRRAQAIRDHLTSEFKDTLRTQGKRISIRVEGEAYTDGQCDQELAQLDPYGYGQECRTEASVNPEKEAPTLLQARHRVAVIKLVGTKK